MNAARSPLGRRIAIACVLAFLTVVRADVPARAQHRETTPDHATTRSDGRTLYRISELPIFAETFRGDFLKLWDGPSGDLPPTRAEIARRQLDKHFSAEVLSRLIVERFDALATSSEAKAVLDWAAAPVGQSIAGRPRTPVDSDLYSALEAYGEAETTAPVEQARVKVLAELARESLLDQIYLSSTSAAALLVSLTLALNENPAEGVPGNAWEQLMPGLFAKAAESRSRYVRATASVLQVEHPHASNGDLEAYLAFRQSPDGRWLSKEAAGVLLGVLERQQRAYTDDLQRIFSRVN